MEANYVYFCSICKKTLNEQGDIILLVKNKKGQEAIIKVSPIPGDFRVEKPDDFSWEKGENLEVLCPECKKSLKVFIESDRALLLLLEKTAAGKKEVKKNVIFSSIIGKNLTYVITPRKIMPYGEHENDNFNPLKCFTW